MQAQPQGHGHARPRLAPIPIPQPDLAATSFFDMALGADEDLTPRPHQSVFDFGQLPAQMQAASPPAAEAAASSSASSSAAPPPVQPLDFAADDDGDIALDDYDDYDDDSAYGDGASMESATTSLRSSITNYPWQHGRRFHAYRAGSYWAPNDDAQNDSMDMGHWIFLIMLEGRLHLAPLDQPRRALDIGTGTGIWAQDFADYYPNCQVVGTDLSPIQPLNVSPNLQFEIDDACSDWTFTKESFDYIHVRGLYGSVADWPKFYEQVYRHLKPGGWFEQVEVGMVPKSDDGSVYPDSIFDRWGRISLDMGDRFGKSLRTVDESKQGVLDAGFVDVAEHRFKLPMAGWSRDARLRELGLYNRVHWEKAMEGWCLYLLTNYCGWSAGEVRRYVSEMAGMLRDRSVHAYQDCSIVVARKPLY